MSMISHIIAPIIGAPFYFCVVLQLAALVLAFLHFRRQRRQRTEVAPAAGRLETEDML